MSLFNRFFLISLFFLCSGSAIGQYYSYKYSTPGHLVVEVFGSNPCMDGATLHKGYINFKVVSTIDGLPAKLNAIIGNGGAGPNLFSPVSIPVGSTLSFFANNSTVLNSSAFTPAIPVGSYE